jgi:hypothetical protein
VAELEWILYFSVKPERFTRESDDRAGLIGQRCIDNRTNPRSGGEGAFGRAINTLYFDDISRVSP